MVWKNALANYIKGRTDICHQGYQYDIGVGKFPFIYKEKKFDKDLIQSLKIKKKMTLLELKKYKVSDSQEEALIDLIKTD